MKQLVRFAAVASVIASAGLFVASDASGAVKHRYQFNDAAGTTIADSVGTANGTLVNTTGNSALDGNKLILGNTGTQSSNGGNGDYVDLPNGLITGLNTGAGTTRFTLEAWFTRTGGNTWQRVWDFGASQGGENVSDSGDLKAQLFLTPQSGGASIRAAWRPEAGAEVSIERPGISALNQRVHATFVWDETSTSARLYLDGIQVVENTGVTMTIANGMFNAGTPLDVNNWLGRAQWNDPLFVGSFEEFRVYDNALTAQEVLDSFANGPDNLTGPGAGAFASIDASTDGQNIVINATSQVSVNAIYANVTVPVATAPGIAFTSSNANVATVSATGLVTGTGPGTANITVNYQGQSDVVSVTVVIPPRPPASIVHRYQFNESVGALTVADSVGTAVGDARGINFTGGQAGFADVQASHVNLPNGIISARENVTIEMWATFAGTGGAWQRFYDIGTTTLGEDPDPSATAPDYNGGGASTYLFYAPRRGGVGNADAGRFTFRNGVAEIVGVNPPNATQVRVGQEAHVVTIYNYAQRQAQVWVNGALVGQSAIPNGETLSKLDDVNVWLGRSQYKGDAFFNGSFNEFRIYEGAMAPLEIAASRKVGPDVANLVGDPGAVQSLSVTAASTTAVEGGAPVTVTLSANFASLTDVDVTGVPGVVLTSSDPNVLQVLTAPYRLLPVGAGSATISGSLDGQNATPLAFTVTAAGALTLVNRYTFDANANDSVGDKHGTLVSTNANPGGVFEDGGLTLAGTGYVDLPNYLFSDFFFGGDVDNLPAVTFEIFGSRAAGGNWQRLLDFGDNNSTLGLNGTAEDPPVGTAYNGRTFLFLTGSNGTQLRVDFNNGAGSLGQVNGTALGSNQDFHVVVVFDPGQGVVRMYRNGVSAGVNTLPATLRQQLVDGTAVLDINNWIGRANFGADPFYQGRIEEFRIWAGGMTQAQAALNFGCGPNSPNGCALPGPVPTIVSGRNGNALTVSWPENALGFGLESTAALGTGAVWAPVATQPLTTGGTRTTTVTPATPTYFRLKADE